MADELAMAISRARREVERYHDRLKKLAVPLDQASDPDHPETLTVIKIKGIYESLRELKTGLFSSTSVLTQLESDEGMIAGDKDNEEKLMTEWDRLQQMAATLQTTYEAETTISRITKSVNRLEQKTARNPTKDYRDPLRRLDIQVADVTNRLSDTNLSKDHDLYAQSEDLEDRIEFLLGSGPTKEDSKDFCKVHVKGSYKISDLAVPKFNGKIDQWIPFWEEYEHAIHTKEDMKDSIKMVYLKQAILDPGLKTTIADLGMTDGAYAAAVKLLQDRFEKPRIIHRLCCEDIKALTPNNNSRVSITEMADKVQHILTGLTRLGSLGASEILTSMTELVMNKELKHEWLLHTEDVSATPPVERLLAFLRKKADRAKSHNK